MDSKKNQFVQAFHWDIFLGQKSHWTIVTLDNCVFGKKSLGPLFLYNPLWDHLLVHVFVFSLPYVKACVCLCLTQVIQICNWFIKSLTLGFYIVSYLALGKVFCYEIYSFVTLLNHVLGWPEK